MSIRVTAAAGFIVVLIMRVAMASGHAAPTDPVVVARQSDMKSMAAAAKTIGDMFKETTAYDTRVFQAAAETIREKSGNTLSRHFGNGPVPLGSKAGPNINAERERFDILSNDLAVYAKALVTAAEQNPDAITPDMRMKTGDAGGQGPFAKKVDAVTAVASMPAEHAFHMMLQTCTSCHARFRIKTD